MKILFTQDALINAGTERSNLELISRFSGEVDASVVYFYPRYDLKEEFMRAGVRLFFLDIPESYNIYLGVKRLIKLIKNEKPDLLVSSLWRADIITRIASFITGVPLVGTLVNDSYSPISWKDKIGLKHKVVYWIDRLTAGIPIHWIANAQALVDSHQKTLGIDPRKVSVIYRGRQVPVIAPAHRGGSDAEEQPVRRGGKQSRDSQILNEETASSSFLAVTPRSIQNFISYGRLLERKGFQDAIQAFSEVVKTYPDCTLTIFGEGTYREELEKLIQGLGLQESVFLPGKIPNPIDVLINGYCIPPKLNCQLPASTSLSTGAENCQLPTANCLLKSAHCFLFPSWYEGFSGALVEAMMAGMPIIASDIPMNLEAVEADKSALVFPVGNSKVLQQKMIYAIEHSEMILELGKAAQSIAIEKFDIDGIAKQYETTLISVYNQSKSNRNK